MAKKKTKSYPESFRREAVRLADLPPLAPKSKVAEVFAEMPDEAIGCSIWGRTKITFCK